MCEAIFSFQEFFKILPGLVIFPFSLYLAAKKVGVHVCFSFTLSLNQIGGRIGSIILVNEKDKPVVIKGILARIENVDFYFKQFEEPLILKAYESVLIKHEPYSFLVVNGEEWDLPTGLHGELKLFIETHRGTYACTPLFKKIPLLKKTWFNRPVNSFRPSAQKYTVRHNGVVYNPKRIKFIVDYIHKGDLMTTFVEPSGFISDSVGLGVNMLNEREMSSPESVMSALKSVNSELSVRVSRHDDR